MIQSTSDTLRLAESRALRVGDCVTVTNLPGRFTVTNTDDPSLIELRSEHGARLRAGRLRVRPVHR